MPRFVTGKSGNPAGRRTGSKDRRTELRDLLHPHAPELIGKLVELALDGDVGALKLCIDRLVSPLRPTEFISEPVDLTTGSLADRARKVTDGYSTGTLSAKEASTLISAVRAEAAIVEVSELVDRLTKLEETINAKGSVAANIKDGS